VSLLFATPVLFATPGGNNRGLSPIFMSPIFIGVCPLFFGKFFTPGAALHLPVYLDAEVQAYLAARAKARGIEVAQLVNELLKKDIELIQTAG
jgi:hypothetical protein